MYSSGIGFSVVASLVGVSISTGTGTVLEAQPTREHPNNVWIKAKQTGQDRVFIQEWVLHGEWCDLLCFPLCCSRLPSPIAFAVLAFLEAVKAGSHDKKLGRPVFFMSFKSLKSELKHFVWAFSLHGAFM